MDSLQVKAANICPWKRPTSTNRPLFSHRTADSASWLILQGNRSTLWCIPSTRKRCPWWKNEKQMNTLRRTSHLTAKLRFATKFNTKSLDFCNIIFYRNPNSNQCWPFPMWRAVNNPTWYQFKPCQKLLLGSESTVIQWKVKLPKANLFCPRACFAVKHEKNQ